MLERSNTGTLCCKRSSWLRVGLCEQSLIAWLPDDGDDGLCMCWTVARRSYVALLLRERENARLLNTFVFVDFIVKEFLDTHRAQSDLVNYFKEEAAEFVKCIAKVEFRGES